MGKLLRNREILDQTDLQYSDNQHGEELLVKRISKQTLKKSIFKKFANKEKQHLQKHFNFQKKINDGLLSTIVEQNKFQCPICLELMVRPTLLLCGHMFCQRCLESNIAHSSNCCLCRQQQNPEEIIPSLLTENLINEVLVPKSSQIIKYLCRTTDACEWIKRRKINNLRPGLIVDFQDIFKVWRRAIVLKIYVGKNQKQLVNIRSFFKGSQILQTLQVSSKRLAPLNFFTRSKYLEEFEPVLSQYDLYEKQLQGLEYRGTLDSQSQFNLNVFQQRPQISLQSIQDQVQQHHFSSPDHTLALFEWEMNVGQFLL